MIVQLVIAIRVYIKDSVFGLEKNNWIYKCLIEVT